MTAPTDYRALCAELTDALDAWQLGGGPPEDTADADLITRARAALNQPEPQGPTKAQLLELMPETMRDEFSYAAKTYSDAMGGRVKPGIFRVVLNTAALEYARAVLARCGTANNTINPGGTNGYG